MSSTKSTKTPFSSYKSPRPVPLPVASVNTSVRPRLPLIRRMVSESSIPGAGIRRRNNELTYDYFTLRYTNRSIRQGHVGIQYDKLRSWSWTRRLWLILDSSRLQFCAKKGAKAGETLMLHQIRQVERIDTKPYCLIVAATHKTWYLFFKDSVSLYDWYYDIRVRCPLLHIGVPTDFRHDLHVTYDRAAQEITGLPEDWIETLGSWGVAPELNRDEESTRSSNTTSHEARPPASEPHHRTRPSHSECTSETLAPTQELRPASRQRSASDATPSRRAASAVPSVEQFRRSPHRYREVDARDLTGAVRAKHLLPTSRHENCDVWKGEWTGAFGNRKVAIQVVQLFDPISDADRVKISMIMRREVKALHQLRHPNVVRIRGFCLDQGPLPALVSTWISGGNIMDLVRDKPPAQGKVDKLRLLTQVAAGLNYLHGFSRMTVHGALRGENVLITDNGSACISGYGLNPVMQELAGDPHSPSPFCSSPRWAAIEVILMGRRHLSYWADVFSFARTVLEVMTGKDPYHYLSDDEDVTQAVIRGIPPRRPPVFGDDGLWHFLERCWKDVPTQRPSMALALLRMEDILSMHDSSTTGDTLREPPGSAPP